MEDKDKWSFLEERQGAQALEWVETQNGITLSELQADPSYAQRHAEAMAILGSDDRIPYVTVNGDMVYNHWQDSVNPKGLWRRTTLASYQTVNPEWEILLDLDRFSVDEGRDWHFHSATYHENRALIHLSEGGGDRVQLREFDLEMCCFVPNGFNTYEDGVTYLDWLSTDTVLINHPIFGETNSGYGRELRSWRRGQPLHDAQCIFTGETTDLQVGSIVFDTGEVSYSFVWRGLSFFQREIYYIDPASQVLHRLDIPLMFDPFGVIDGQFVMIIHEDWRGCKAGSVIALHLVTKKISVIFEPTDRIFLTRAGGVVTKSTVVLELIDTVIGRLRRYRQQTDGSWSYVEVPVPDKGVVSVSWGSSKRDDLLVKFSSFLQPDSLLYISSENHVTTWKQLPSQFDASDMIVEQRWAKSSDGVEIPYFIVGKQSVFESGPAPVLMYGYGGFRSAKLPEYNAMYGKLWMEQGGVYALINPRGGGEFGAAWHEAGKRLKRQTVFNDCYAVTESLIATGVTTAEQVCIRGGSNGGLLVAVAMTQRPELYASVFCSMPLLNMEIYHLLPPGDSWRGEYGTVDDSAEDRTNLLGYSPYHNVFLGREYPRVFFYTTRGDDRVQPYHARAMAAKMLEQGHSVLFYEGASGGHAVKSLTEVALQHALEFTYHWSRVS